MSKEPDILVVGAGHNALVAAAYLARAGASVLILEKNDIAGGGAVSRELTIPGFSHDTHAAATILMQGSPVLTHDELELKSKFGLELIDPPNNEMTVFADGDTIVWYRDLDKTCSEIAKFSEKDAEAYRKTVNFVMGVMPVMGMSSARPPVSFGSFVSLLEKAPFGNELILAMMKSTYEVITERFDHPKVRIALLKKSMVSVCGPEERGTGLNILFMMASVHAFPLAAIAGGTQKLTEATIKCIEASGGEVRLNSKVTRIVNSGGEVRRVELEDGSVLTARKAVLASIHPHFLGDIIEGLEPGLVHRAKSTSSSQLATLMIHAALDEKVKWNVGPIADECMYVYMIDATELQDFRDSYDSVRRGNLPTSFASGVQLPTVFDPSRAPPGKHVMSSYYCVPFDLREGGSAHWDELKRGFAERALDRIAYYAPNLSGANILSYAVESPLDLARHSPSFTAGDVSGIGVYIHQMMGMRPTPELAQYRVPGAQGLYLAGPFMHPGPGISGGGRAVAIRMMEDLKIDTKKVLKI